MKKYRRRSVHHLTRQIPCRRQTPVPRPSFRHAWTRLQAPRLGRPLQAMRPPTRPQRHTALPPSWYHAIHPQQLHHQLATVPRYYRRCRSGRRTHEVKHQLSSRNCYDVRNALEGTASTFMKAASMDLQRLGYAIVDYWVGNQQQRRSI